MIAEHKLIEGAYLFASAMGNVLIGCPPEILKEIISQQLPMPDTVIIPETLTRFHSSQTSLEFPFYHFLFVQRGPERGKKFRVLAEKEVCKKLENLLRITLLGPQEEEIMTAEKKLGIPEHLDRKKIKQVLREINYLYLKKDGKPIPLGDMVEFIPFEVGDEAVLYETGNPDTDIRVTRQGGDRFSVFEGSKKREVILSVEHPQNPPYKITGKKVTKKEKDASNAISIRVLGSSSGFDPAHPANGYIFHFNRKWVSWDCPAYFQNHLEKLGLTIDDMDAIFISHVHEDHLDPVEAISQNKRTDIYTSPEIYHSLLIKLQAVFRCSYKEAQSYFTYHPIYANQPFDLFGARAEVFYSLHALPSLGFRLFIKRGNDQEIKIFISGDNLSQRVIQDIDKNGLFSAERLKEVRNFVSANDHYDYVFVDSGGGQIHGDAKDFYESRFQIFHMHTSGPLPNLPGHQKLLMSGDFFDLT